MQKHFSKIQCRQKGISTLVGIIIIIAVAIIAFGGVFAYEYFAKSQTPTINVQPTPNFQKQQNQNSGTAGWKTYTNTQYGFEIKYSNPAKLSPILQGIQIDINGIAGSIFVSKLKKINDGWDNSSLSNRTINCIVDKNDESIKGFYNYKDLKNINNINFYHYINYPDFIGKFCGMSSGCWYNDVYRIVNGDVCYEITYTRSHREISKPEQIPDLINQIVSTFKFTK